MDRRIDLDTPLHVKRTDVRVLRVLALAICCWLPLTAGAQTNTMQYVASGASGTECPNGAADDPASCDWYLDESGGIVLNAVPQIIFWELYLDEWGLPGEFPDSILPAYLQELFCDSLDNGTACIEPAPGGTANSCDSQGLIPGVDFCNGIDESRTDFVYFGKFHRPSFPESACDLQLDASGVCPTQSGSGVASQHGIPSQSPTYADGGSVPKYAGTHAANVPVDARGIFTVEIHPNSQKSFMRTNGGIPLEPVTRIPMQVEIVSGRCCGVAGQPLMCGADFLPGDCAAAGGIFAEGASCCGVDDQVTDGVDDACMSCDGVVVAGAGAAECDDNDACTLTACFVNDCGATACVTNPTPVGADSTLCCDPTTGDGTVIDDGDDCTVDICDPDTGFVLHDLIDIPECTEPSPVPTVSTWGLAALALLLLVLGKLAWGRHAINRGL